jgi:hypothetical protein
MKQSLPDGELAYFIMDMVNPLNLSVICDSYNTKGGQPPFGPKIIKPYLL